MAFEPTQPHCGSADPIAVPQLPPSRWSFRWLVPFLGPGLPLVDVALLGVSRAGGADSDTARNSRHAAEVAITQEVGPAEFFAAYSVPLARSQSAADPRVLSFGVGFVPRAGVTIDLYAELERATGDSGSDALYGARFAFRGRGSTRLMLNVNRLSGRSDAGWTAGLGFETRF